MRHRRELAARASLPSTIAASNSNAPFSHKIAQGHLVKNFYNRKSTWSFAGRKQEIPVCLERAMENTAQWIVGLSNRQSKAKKSRGHKMIRETISCRLTSLTRIQRLCNFRYPANGNSIQSTSTIFYWCHGWQSARQRLTEKLLIRLCNLRCLYGTEPNLFGGWKREKNKIGSVIYI